jgi:hypothetical protein
MYASYSSIILGTLKKSPFFCGAFARTASLEADPRASSSLKGFEQRGMAHRHHILGYIEAFVELIDITEYPVKLASKEGNLFVGKLEPRKPRNVLYLIFFYAHLF